MSSVSLKTIIERMKLENVTPELDIKKIRIAQPDINSPADITRLGEPKLFWGVSAGALDSMVANYTASKKPRKSEAFSPRPIGFEPTTYRFVAGHSIR